MQISPTVGDTASGTIAIGDGDPTDLTFDVLPGITTLTVASGEVIADGAAHPVTFTAGLAGGVTQPGTVTFTADPDVALSCDDKKPAATVDCSIGDGGSIQLLVTVSPNRKPGSLSLTATDEGQRTLPTTTLQVVTPARLELSDSPRRRRRPRARPPPSP